jgi:hypothetical protein
VWLAIEKPLNFSGRLGYAPRVGQGGGFAQALGEIV